MSTLDPAGPGSAPIAMVWWVMFWGSMLILLAVTGLALYAACRPTGARMPFSPRALIIGGGLIFPVVVLALLLAFGVRSGHALLPLPTDDEVITIQVTGHQWWWEVRYPDQGHGAVYGANEIHVPAGRPVDVELRAADVIHSFWVPRLGGKLDAVPGHVNRLRIQADEPGIYRGQCAEFCGRQHARMGFYLIAHEEEDYRRQLDQLRRRPDPDDEATAPGRETFQQHCATCHAVHPGEQDPGIGPNLAGVANRDWLGAGVIENTDSALFRWLRNHQHIKPGNHMPVHDALDDDELEAIVDYLEHVR